MSAQDKVHLPESGAEVVAEGGSHDKDGAVTAQRIVVSNTDSHAPASGQHMEFNDDRVEQAAEYSSDNERKSRIVVANPGSNAHEHGYTPEGSPPPIYMPRVREARHIDAHSSFVNAVFDQSDGDSYFDELSLSDFRDPEDCCDPCMACCGCLALKRFNQGLLLDF